MESILGRLESKTRRVFAGKAATAPAGTIAGDLGEQLVSLTACESYEANKYRVLAHRIEFSNADGGHAVIAVTSPGAGEGKTTTAINIAGTLAQPKEARVLLIDADLRLPDVAPRLGFRDNGRPGLSDALLDASLPLEALVTRRPPFGLWVLTAGRRVAAPYEALRQPRLGEIFDQARRAYDYVIVDMPPVLPVPDCRVIARWADSLLVVVAAHRTPRRFLEETLNALDPAKVAGLIFNGVDPPRPGPYAYYRGYGAPPAR